MPTYDYECAKCGHSFDAFQSMSDDPLTKCPSCGKAGLRRLIGGGLGVIFKGSGFYVTDSRSGGGKASKSKSESSSSESSTPSNDSSSASKDSNDGTSSSSGKSSDSKKQKSTSGTKAAT